MTKEQNVGCLFGLLKLLWLAPRAGVDRDEELPYRQRDDFLSPAEVSFYHVLRQAIGDQFTICCKVRVADVLFVVERRTNLSFANKIDRKHVDFLLCEPSTMKLRLAIELDDASHERSDRQARDQLVDAAFAAAGLPLLRFAAQRQYDVRQIAAEISAVSRRSAGGSSAPAVVTGESVPTCPKCATPMVVRQAKRGPRTGKQFYACPNYPQCKSTLPYDG